MDIIGSIICIIFNCIIAILVSKLNSQKYEINRLEHEKNVLETKLMYLECKITEEE